MSFDYFAAEPEAEALAPEAPAPDLVAPTVTPEWVPMAWRSASAPRPLPHNIEAEWHLIGCVMFDNDAFWRVPEGLEAEHFYEPVNQRLWEKIGGRIRRGVVAEPTVLEEDLRGDPALAELGGIRFLADLIDRAPPSTTVAEYARLVHDLGLRRSLMRAASEMFWSAQDNETSGREQLEAAERSLLGLRLVDNVGARVMSADEASAEVFAHLDASDSDLGAVRTGLEPVDRAIGFLLPGELHLLGGRPGMGKSTIEGGICLNVAWPAFRQLDPGLDDHQRFALQQTTGEPMGVLKISGEMAVKQMTWRMLADIAFMLYGAKAPTYSRIKKRTITTEQRAMLEEARRHFDQIPLRQLKRTGIKLSGLRSLARRERARFARMGIKLGLVTMDHVGLVQPEGRTSGEYEAQSQIARGLKELAGELEVPILALIQLSRQVEQRDDKRPNLADLRASGQWEENADGVMLAYREAYYALKEKEPIAGRGADSDLKWSDWDRRRKSKDLDLIMAKTRDDEGGDVKLWCAVGHHAVRGIEPSWTGGFDFSSIVHPSATDGALA